jgi:AraC-like DNA-binding protein
MGWFALPVGRWRMQGSGTAKFTDAGDYQSSIRGARCNFVLSHQKGFEAKLTWVDLRHLRLLRAEENLPRVAHVSLTPDLAFVAFPTRHDPPQIYDGIELQPGEIVFHGLGESMHLRTRGPSRWSLISVAPKHLAACGKALTGVELAAPPVARIVRPSRLDSTHLLRLHAQACRLAETKPGMITKPEVGRALEQDLLYTLVNCLTSHNDHTYSATKRHHMRIISLFESVLARSPERQLQIPELCAAIGVPERTLRICSAEFLGMSPTRYVRLQRLNSVRAALRCAGAQKTTVKEIATRYGFSELGRFAADYRTVFGETPSTTLRNSKSTRASRVSAEIA